MSRIGLTLTVVLVLAAASTSTTVSAASPGEIPASPGAAKASISASTKAGKAHARALKKCRRINLKAKRQACVKRVNRNFHTKPDKAVPQPDPAAVIQVGDDYYSPDAVSIKSGDSIRWVWLSDNADPHNVTLISGPAGVDRLEFQSASSPATGMVFQRTFITPGTYVFSCSLHYHQEMTVEVSS